MIREKVIVEHPEGTHLAQRSDGSELGTLLDDSTNQIAGQVRIIRKQWDEPDPIPEPKPVGNKAIDVAAEVASDLIMTVLQGVGEALWENRDEIRILASHKIKKRLTGSRHDLNETKAKGNPTRTSRSCPPWVAGNGIGLR